MKIFKRDNLAIGIVLLLVLVYIFYECYSVTHITENRNSLPFNRV